MNKSVSKQNWVSEDVIKQIKHKRGRKSKKELELLSRYQSQLDELGIVQEEKKIKKRGRKPKGGKIITNIDKINNVVEFEPNIILHLKCKSSDINNLSIINVDYNPNIEQVIAFNEENDVNITNFYNIEVSKDFVQDNISNEYTNESKVNKHEINNVEPDTECHENNTPNIKIIWNKLRELQQQLHNNVINKKSNCFWCTCVYDNPTVYIPRCIINGKIEVEGCYCMPECAVADLFRKDIDISTKWERYALLNNMYKPIYQYNQNIKPAPSPYYTLDKYLGNLTIQEYRKLSTKDNFLLIVDKPLTRILPELHDDLNEYPKINYNTDNKRKEYRLKRTKPLKHTENNVSKFSN